ncbi:MAG: histidyl-tRNA synthetase [Solirubrobacteraceae bacterium]|nr:histidyl-tRNA synthetase [Solirubrobacteraceae bacterium]
MDKLQAARGTFDVLPDEGYPRLRLLRLAEETLGRAAFGPIETPIFEATELFERGVGETTDVVEKEMFTFEDQGGRSLTLRPEGTAGVCRAYVEHGMHKLPQPVKLWYWGPFFRYEAPQAGRYRQFTQVGIEAIGSDHPSLDAEAILLLAELLERVGTRGVRLRISSLGTPETRRAYSDELREHLRAREAQLSDDVRARLDRNPLRAFDSDHPGTLAALKDAPRLIDRLAPEDAHHFAEVRALLDAAGQEYVVDGTLVRGLDYYTRTVFEFESSALGAQSARGGGGRYDRLVERLGGPPTPGVGWAAGVERILLAAGDQDAQQRRGTAEAAASKGGQQRRGVYVALAEPERIHEGFALTRELRARDVIANIEQAGRSLKGQLKHADRVGAKYVVILGDGIEIKDMATGQQVTAASVKEALDVVTAERP